MILGRFSKFEVSVYGSETKFRIWIQDIADPDQHGKIRKTFPRSETIIADLKSNITNNLRSDPNRKYFFIQLRTVIRTRHNCQKHDDFLGFCAQCPVPVYSVWAGFLSRRFRIMGNAFVVCGCCCCCSCTISVTSFLLQLQIK